MQQSAHTGLSGGMNRRRFGRAGLGALGLAVAAPLRAAAQADVVAEELRMISSGALAGLDPTALRSGSTLRSIGAAEGLLRVTPFGDIEGQLARAYELLDPLTWRVELHPQATFWSGKAVDARAVVESLERSRALDPAAATLLSGVSVEPADEWSVLFRTAAPHPGLPLNLTNESLVIHHAASYGATVNAFDLGAADLTGFFKLAGWVPREWALLERNDRYWGTVARMRRVRLLGVVDVEARALAALSGEANVVRLLPESAARQIERSRMVRLIAVPHSGCERIYLNVHASPFDDVRVRQALAWAVDREALVDAGLDGRGRPAASWLAHNPTYPEATKVGYTRYDVAKAAQLLDEAGWRLARGGRVRMKDGRRLAFRLLWWGHTRPMAEVLQAQWAKIGAEVEVQGSGDYALVESRVTQGDWDAHLNVWGTIDEPAVMVARYLGADGDRNHGRLNDPVIERLLAEFAGLADPEARRQQALRANERAAEVVPFIPLAMRERLTAVSRSMRNYDPHFFDIFDSLNPDVWVAA